MRHAHLMIKGMRTYRMRRIYIHTYIYMYVNTLIHTYVYMYTYIHTYTHTHTHTHIQVWLLDEQLSSAPTGYRAVLVGADALNQHTSAYVSIRQHTSAYVSMYMRGRICIKPDSRSIRQHTSAYVSIRQHTSACICVDAYVFRPDTNADAYVLSPIAARGRIRCVRLSGLLHTYNAAIGLTTYV
jgi:hypothetical protein